MNIRDDNWFEVWFSEGGGMDPHTCCLPGRAAARRSKVTLPTESASSSPQKNGIMKPGWIISMLDTTPARRAGFRQLIPS